MRGLDLVLLHIGVFGNLDAGSNRIGIGIIGLAGRANCSATPGPTISNRLQNSSSEIPNWLVSRRSDNRAASRIDDFCLLGNRSLAGPQGGGNS